MHTEAGRHVLRLRRALLGVAFAATVALAVVGPDDSDTPRVLAAQRAYLGDAYVPPGGPEVYVPPEGPLTWLELRQESMHASEHGRHTVLFADGLLLSHVDRVGGGIVERIGEIDTAEARRVLALAEQLAARERPDYCGTTIHCWHRDVVLRLGHASGVVTLGERPWHTAPGFKELSRELGELASVAEYHSFGVLAEPCVDSTGFGTRRPVHDDATAEDAP